MLRPGTGLVSNKEAVRLTVGAWSVRADAIVFVILDPSGMIPVPVISMRLLKPWRLNPNPRLLPSLVASLRRSKR